MSFPLNKLFHQFIFFHILRSVSHKQKFKVFSKHLFFPIFYAYISFHICLLTPWSKVLLEKLTDSNLVKKFPTFYKTRRFSTAFTNARHLSLFWARSIQSMHSLPTPWGSILILFSHLRLGLQSGLFPQVSPPKPSIHLCSPRTCYMPRLSPLLDLMISYLLYPKIWRLKYTTLQIFLVGFQGYECSPVTLAEEHRLRMSENRMLRERVREREIWGPKMDEIRGQYWKIAKCGCSWPLLLIRYN